MRQGGLARGDPPGVGVTFRDLCEAMEAAGVDVSVELAAGRHRIVLADRGRDRRICLPVRGGFDRTAAVLVASARLRELLGQAGAIARPDGAIATGRWPELLAAWPSEPAGSSTSSPPG